MSSLKFREECKDCNHSPVCAIKWKTNLSGECPYFDDEGNGGRVSSAVDNVVMLRHRIEEIVKQYPKTDHCELQTLGELHRWQIDELMKLFGTA